MTLQDWCIYIGLGRVYCEVAIAHFPRNVTVERGISKVPNGVKAESLHRPRSLLIIERGKVVRKSICMHNSCLGWLDNREEQTNCVVYVVIRQLTSLHPIETCLFNTFRTILWGGQDQNE